MVGTIDGFKIPRHYILQDVLIFLLTISFDSEIVTSPWSLKSNTSIINCYRYLWRMRTMPYVRLDELKEFTEKHWMNKRCVYCCRNLQWALKLYECIFPELTTGPVTPRSLKHLSRCTIRKSLKKDSQGKLDIAELEIPNELNLYLKLEF